MDSKKLIKIYTDGACQPNPGKAGSGIVIFENKKPVKMVYGGFLPYATNNIAELNALYHGVRVASKYLSSGFTNVELLADSKYSLDCINTWIHSWLKTDFKSNTVKNRELIEKIYAIYKPISKTLKLTHIRGHQGNIGNECADRMAVYAVRTKSEKLTEFKFQSLDAVLAMK